MAYSRRWLVAVLLSFPALVFAQAGDTGPPVLQEPDAIAVDSEQMLLYWSDGSVGSINRLDLSTGKAVVLVNDLEVPLGIAISPERDRLYWSELGKQAIFQANLDGSGVTPLLNEVGVPAGIALDDERGRLYWADAIGEIRYTSLDEPSVEILVAEGVEMPRDVAVGPASGRVYWTDTRRDLVGYVDPTGGEAQFILSDDLLSPISLAVCEDSEVIYVTDDGADAVYRLPVAGGAAFVRYKPFHPTGIVMDCGSATLYWSDIATSAIYVGNLEQDETQRRLYPASE